MENLQTSTIITAFLLTLFAGLATGVGSLLAFVAHHTNKKMLSFSLGLSAGVMIFVSFKELLPEGEKMISSTIEGNNAGLVSIVAFFLGMGVVALIDKLVPDSENPHTAHVTEDMDKASKAKLEKSKLMRMGLMSAIAIAIHNFPEGIATFASALHDTSLGVSIAVAVAIHNIPEGIAVAVPIYHSTGDRKKAFIYSFLSGLAEPLGAIVAFFALRYFLNDLLLGIIFSSVAGIMVFISLDELLPAAEEYGEHHICIYGTLLGMAIMAISLIIV